MLIEFRVENHRSIRDEQVLTMEAGRGGDPKDLRPRVVEGHATPLLPAAAIYGANASGKSNIIDALHSMQHAVLRSHRNWDPEGGVVRDPFAWGEHIARPSLFEVTFLLNGVRHQYGFVADDEQFLEEWLHAWPNGRRQAWFEREGRDFKFGEHLHGENRIIESVTRSNALFLSAAAQHRHEQLAPIYRWFASIRQASTEDSMVEWLSSLLPPPKGQQHSLFEHIYTDQAASTALDAVKGLLRAADLGIVDVRQQEASYRRRLTRQPRVEILLRHQNADEEAWLPLQEESKGTITLLQLARPVLQALTNGGMVVVDELEASLHPLLALRLVQQFNDPSSNPKHAQILFSTHDTNLLGTTMGEPVLRRDQVWLTEKDTEGATVIYPLTDYKPRKAESLERGYLQGRYGAIPFLGNLTEAIEQGDDGKQP